MGLGLPCNIGYGEKLETADCYADLYLYPGGHFLMRVSVRANNHRMGANINVGFGLFDASGAPVSKSIFGMKAEEAITVPMIGRGFPPERLDTVAGVVPAELLERTERIAICFRPQGTLPDWESLRKQAGIAKLVLPLDQ